MSNTAVTKSWLVTPVQPAVRQTIERLSRAPDVAHVAVMPDVHLAAGVSNGVVVATNQLLYPAAVGGDIGCGFAAVAFGGNASMLNRRPAAESVLASLPDSIPIIRHRRRNGLPELRDELSADTLTAPGRMASAGRNWARLAEATTSSNFRPTTRDAFGSWYTAVRGRWDSTSQPFIFAMHNRSEEDWHGWMPTPMSGGHISTMQNGQGGTRQRVVAEC
ncbi:MAG: hypothetical protein GXP29_00390 [Planctomycetes bacterium]|nr:hypothetical protein [Planctomycetota bacterium]